MNLGAAEHEQQPKKGQKPRTLHPDSLQQPPGRGAHGRPEVTGRDVRPPVVTECEHVYAGVTGGCAGHVAGPNGDLWARLSACS